MAAAKSKANISRPVPSAMDLHRTGGLVRILRSGDTRHTLRRAAKGMPPAIANYGNRTEAFVPGSEFIIKS